ncbi:unnamed protein product [Rotaria sordida]|uniref:Uncharacterized protein n=1 Tax=Rotaria sordida TaxID=392033 RepID=A0A814Q437_9BILA|nr:unnamed protein product [Rotaria sordida]
MMFSNPISVQSCHEAVKTNAQIIVAVPKELFFRSSGKNDYLRRPFLSVYYKATQTRNETHFDATQSHKWLRIVEKVNYNPAPHDTT